MLFATKLFTHCIYSPFDAHPILTVWILFNIIPLLVLNVNQFHPPIGIPWIYALVIAMSLLACMVIPLSPE